MNKTSEKFSLSIIHWGNYLILFIPFLVYRRTLFPYIFVKIIIFQILVEIIFVFWLCLMIFNKKYRPDFKNPLVLSSTIFIGILFLTMFTGVDFSRSFWGTHERMTGIFTILHFYIWFLILTSCFKDWRDWRKFIWVSLGCSFLVGLYGLGQKLGFQFLLREADVTRLSSTLGNPIFLAVYAMMHIFLAGFLIFVERKWFLKSLAIFLIIFNLIIMPLSASRGVFWSFGFTLILFFILLIILISSKKIKITIIFLLLLIISGFIFLQTSKVQPYVEKLPYSLKRIVDLKELKEFDWTRTLAWNIAFQGFKEKPIFGWGWENYNIVFNKYYNPRYLEGGFAETWFDKSHNQILDLLVLTGIFGIISYLAIFFSLFRALYKRVRKNTEMALSGKIAVGILGLMFSAYFVQNLSVFDTPASLIIFYFGLGLVYFITNSTDYESNQTANKDQLRGGKSLKKFSFFLVIVLSVFAIYKFNIKPLRQSHFAYLGANLSLTNLETGLGFYKKALSRPCFVNSEIRLQLVKSLLGARGYSNTSPSVLKGGLEFAISEIEKSIKEHPLDVRQYLFLGKTYNAAAVFDKSYSEKAEKTLQIALEFSPKRQEIYYDLGWAKLSQKKYDESIDIYKKALNLNENVIGSYWNLGLAYLSAGKYKEGLEEINIAHQMGYSYYRPDPNITLFIAKAFSEVGDYTRAISLCDFVLSQIDSGNIDAMALKTIYLVKSGSMAEALKLLGEISKINPDVAKEVEEFINKL